MPSFTYQLGSVDLSNYVRVGPDEGFDPYDASGFEEPSFVESPFAEGQTLANVDVRNREQVVPLYLNAASKGALHALQQQINRELRYGPRPLRVRWQDTGAADPTFYDVEYARFDPEFSLRKSDKGWLAGVLRVWEKGYGHTGSYRVVGTAQQAWSHQVAAPIASIGGDVDAQLGGTAQWSHASQAGFALSLAKPILAISPLPSGWVSAFGPSALNPSSANPGVIVAASRAIASCVLHVEPISAAIPGDRNLYFAPSVAYADIPARVLAHIGLASRANVASVRTLAMTLISNDGMSSAGTVFATAPAAGADRLFDLGVVRANGAATSQLLLRFQARNASAGTVPSLVYRLQEMYVLPEQRTHLIESRSLPLSGGNGLTIGYALDEGVDLARMITGGATSSFRTLRSGAPPRLVATGAPRVAVTMLPLGPQDANGFLARPAITAEVRVRERFTFAR